MVAQERSFYGIPASAGVAWAPAFVLAAEELSVPSYRITPEQIPAEISRFEAAILETRSQILSIRGELTQRLGETEASIFDAHLLVLEDPALIEETIRVLREKSCNIESAFFDLASQYIEAFTRIEDSFIRERVSDIKDVSRRIIRNLLGKNLPLSYRMTTPSVLVARDLTPSEAAILEPAKVLAVVTELGGRTSHASIIARALGVPAVVGARGILEGVQTGQMLLVNGGSGEAILFPSPETLKSHGRTNEQWEARQKLWTSRATLGAVTPDKQRITVMANLESVDEAASALEKGAEGIGLFRTEYLFLRQERFPNEEEQLAAYRKILQTFGDRSVTIRTLDLGGDKKVGKYFDKAEKNPFLGYRAIRFCLENRELFKVQLRALLRASVYGNLRVMFPMISGAPELAEAVGVLNEARRELDGKGIAYDKSLKVGSMVEIPSAAYSVDLLAEHCQFLSIGTNDLIQYLLACDRVNDRIAYLYEPTHPAVVRTLKTIMDAASKARLEVSICGEMASDGLYLPLLLGLGLRRFSVHPKAVAEVKHLARHMSIGDCASFVERALANPKADILGELRSIYAQVSARAD